MKALHALLAGLVLGAGAIWGLLIILVAVPIILAACVLFAWLLFASPVFMLAGEFGLMPSSTARDLAMFPAQTLVIGGMAVGVLWGVGLLLRALIEAVVLVWRKLNRRA